MTALKAARHARGWSGAQFAARLHALGVAHGLVLARPASLRRMMHWWEAGARQPGPLYRQLLCRLYQARPEQLGFDAPPPRRDPVDLDATTALLYAAPVSTGELALTTLPIAAQYVRTVLETAACPDPTELAAGLRQARAQCAPWLDQVRLVACEYLALRLAEHHSPPIAPTTQVPAWLTDSRTAAAGAAAQVFHATAS